MCKHGNRDKSINWLLEFFLSFSCFTVKSNIQKNKREAFKLVFPKSCRGFFQGHVDQKSQCLNVLNDCFKLVDFYFYIFHHSINFLFFVVVDLAQFTRRCASTEIEISL